MKNDEFVKDLFWTSYRYCIGRHSYVTTFANEMADYFYGNLTNEEKEHYAQDIRMQLEDYLHMQMFNFHYDWSFDRNSRKPVEDFLEFLNTQDIKNGKDLCKIKDIEAYIENGELQYAVSHIENPKFEFDICEYEILDLLPWSELASLFDVKNHKFITIKDEEESVVVEAYEAYINDSTTVTTNGKYKEIKTTPWKYKKIYRPVDHKLSNCFIPEDNILKIV